MEQLLHVPFCRIAWDREDLGQADNQVLTAQSSSLMKFRQVINEFEYWASVALEECIQSCYFFATYNMAI